VPAIVALAKPRGIITLMDNTWGAGLIYKPLAHGVDISIQALTKYVGGHSDVFMGSACASDPEILQKLDDAVWQMGYATSPDDAYLMLRGLRTLNVRMNQHAASTLDIAGWLCARPEVSEVLCPALPGARGYDLWKRDYTGLCGLFSLTLKPGPKRAVDGFINALELFGLGFSWGGYESLAIPCDPQLTRTAADPDLKGPLIRLHIGLEDVDDLKVDLDQALKVYGQMAGLPRPYPQS
jgi:cystathionine beta-lyase